MNFSKDDIDNAIKKAKVIMKDKDAQEKSKKILLDFLGSKHNTNINNPNVQCHVDLKFPK